MARFFIDISYHGANYAGWQIQPNANTVQEELEKALSTVIRKSSNCVGAGRTDTGVHARQLMVHFDIEGGLPDRFLYAMNGVLPRDISVNAVYLPKITDLHARFSATSRAYTYRISTRKDPMTRDISHWVRHDLDLAKLNKASKILLQYEDFASFCKAHGDQKTTLCRIDHAYWYQKDEMILFKVKANRFLRGMVRALVGTLLPIGANRETVDSLHSIIQAKDRSVAGPNAEARGLTLSSVYYPRNAFQLLEGKTM